MLRKALHGFGAIQAQRMLWHAGKQAPDGCACVGGGCAQTASKLYLVLDFVNGGHLFFQLYRQGIFDEDLARLYTAELVLAIAHLHGLGIAHRDLKPVRAAAPSVCPAHMRAWAAHLAACMTGCAACPA